MWSIIFYAWCVCECTCANEKILWMVLDLNCQKTSKWIQLCWIGKFFNRFSIEHKNPHKNNENHLSLIRPLLFSVGITQLIQIYPKKANNLWMFAKHAKTKSNEPLTFREENNSTVMISNQFLFLDHSNTCRCNWNLLFVHWCLHIAMQSYREKQKHEIYNDV